MDLVFLGPPGAGKGTQAKRVADRLGVPHLSTGDLLREAVRGRTALGNEAQAFMDKGQLVPDQLVDRMVEEKLSSEACAGGFLLDGYPRNVAQAAALDRIEQKRGRALDAVILIDVPDAILEDRLTGRRSCPADGMMYHITANPPRKQAGRCDRCGGALVVRADDRPEVVRDRLVVYHRETRPLVDYYRASDLVRTVDGTAGIDAVTPAILHRLGRG